MKSHKKYMSMAAILSATALTSVFAASGMSIGQPNTVNKNIRNKSPHVRPEIEHFEHKKELITSLSFLLGKDEELIVQKVDSGLSPKDIIQEFGVDEASIQKSLIAQHVYDMKNHLIQKVSYGELTQKEADRILTKIEENLS